MNNTKRYEFPKDPDKKDALLQRLCENLEKETAFRLRLNPAETHAKVQDFIDRFGQFWERKLEAIKEEELKHD